MNGSHTPALGTGVASPHWEATTGPRHLGAGRQGGGDRSLVHPHRRCLLRIAGTAFSGCSWGRAPTGAARLLNLTLFLLLLTRGAIFHARPRYAPTMAASTSPASSCGFCQALAKALWNWLGVALVGASVVRTSSPHLSLSVRRGGWRPSRAPDLIPGLTTQNGSLQMLRCASPRTTDPVHGHRAVGITNH